MGAPPISLSSIPTSFLHGFPWSFPLDLLARLLSPPASVASRAPSSIPLRHRARSPPLPGARSSSASHRSIQQVHSAAAARLRAWSRRRRRKGHWSPRVDLLRSPLAQGSTAGGSGDPAPRSAATRNPQPACPSSPSATSIPLAAAARSAAGRPDRPTARAALAGARSAPACPPAGRAPPRPVLAARPPAGCTPASRPVPPPNRPAARARQYPPDRPTAARRRPAAGPRPAGDQRPAAAAGPPGLRSARDPPASCSTRGPTGSRPAPGQRRLTSLATTATRPRLGPVPAS